MVVDIKAEYTRSHFSHSLFIEKLMRLLCHQLSVSCLAETDNFKRADVHCFFSGSSYWVQLPAVVCSDVVLDCYDILWKLHLPYLNKSSVLCELFQLKKSTPPEKKSGTGHKAWLIHSVAYSFIKQSNYLTVWKFFLFQSLHATWRVDNIISVPRSMYYFYCFRKWY